MTDLRLGAVQLRIMRVLWEWGRANARKITAALNENSEHKIAHSTVQTLLRQLEDKKAIAHEVKERTFVFYPLVEHDQITKSEIRQVLDRLFAGSPGGLMAYLLKQESIPRKELEKIKELIAEKECKS